MPKTDTGNSNKGSENLDRCVLRLWAATQVNPAFDACAKRSSAVAQGPEAQAGWFLSGINHHRGAELQHRVDILDLVVRECDAAGCPVPILDY